MKEQDFINSIISIAGERYIGDDCAYLKEFGIVVSQDNLAENIHFNTKWCTPYQLGFKSTAVNISDILASGAKPKYITIGLSLPDKTTNDFVKNFYLGVSDALFGAEIIGGDITGSQKDIFVSITAIGTTKNRKISSRKNAKEGYKIVVKGNHGSSAAGLRALKSGNNNEELIKAHLLPQLEYNFSQFISKNIKQDYAMMDTSDGLADALYKIAEASNVRINIDINKVPHIKDVTTNDILFGGEDYKLVAALPDDFAQKTNGTIIGEVTKYDGIRLDINNKQYSSYDELTLFNHFTKSV